MLDTPGRRASDRHRARGLQSVPHLRHRDRVAPVARAAVQGM